MNNVENLICLVFSHFLFLSPNCAYLFSTKNIFCCWQDVRKICALKNVEINMPALQFIASVFS